MFCEDDMFYGEAMNLYQDAGHIFTSLPIYANHTYKQVIYFDSEKPLLPDLSMTRIIEQARYISHLFDLGDSVFEIETGSQISYYSIVLGCDKKNRSKIAHDIHFLLHQSFSANLSVVLFKHENSFLMSIAGFDNDIILSDWYSYFEKYDVFVQLIHVAQLSIESTYEFVADLSYFVARECYKHPAFAKTEIYGLVPTHYFCTASPDDREPIKDLVKRLASEEQHMDDDDYVEPITEYVYDLGDIDAELNMLSFELDREDGIPEAISGGDGDEFDDIELDEYEYKDVDPEIFDDPSLMLKWFDKEE